MRRIWILGVILSLLTGAAFAQGTQTGTLTGTVTSSDGATLPGVTITVTSPALIGARTTVSDGNGAYIFKGLPPGLYKATFEISSFGTQERQASVTLGDNVQLDVALSLGGVEETVTVVGEAPSIVASTQGGETYSNRQIDSLAIGRTLSQIAALAPGLTTNTPNGGQLTISGAFAYDNIFLVDGVDVNDNLFGSANALFIEDAVEQTQVLTSGVSAEYGRFSGGVVNTLTKSGANVFSGSFRTDFTNPKWTKRTPFETENDIERKSAWSKVFSATLGGPIVKDKVWFFVAGRTENRTTQDTFDFTGGSFTDTLENRRFEGKVTAALDSKNTLQALYMLNNTTDTSPTFSFSIDPRTINTSRNPNNLFVGTYRGVLSPTLFVEAQYSQKKFEFAEGGGSSTRREDSPFFTFGITNEPGLHYNAPYFGSTVDPESRDNRQLTANLSYFLTTQGVGKHDLKVGFENYRSTNIGGNTQSSTGFVYYADYITGPGGDLVPVWEPEQNLFLNWLASPGARIDLTTNSFYVNDKITAGTHWSFNVGARYERVRSEATGGIVGVDTDTLVPRLAASFDARGDGKLVLKGSYAHYAGKYSEAQFASNTRVGNPSLVYGIYIGPSGTGRDFAPGLDTNNYVLLNASLPDANVFFEPNLSSPISKEYTFAAATSFGGGKGYGQLTYVNRKTTNFVEDFITIENGTIDVGLPTPCIGCDGTVMLDRRVFRNTDIPRRDYQALQAQFGYRVSNKWNIQGHWTHQFKYDGNFEGEGTNTPGISSAFGDYPEIFVPERNFPTGRISGFQRDKVRLWTTYDLGLGKFGSLDTSLLYNYDSPTTYSLALSNFPVSAVQQLRDPGYALLPGTQTVFFGGRGQNFFEASHIFDLAVMYSIPVYKKAQPYVKIDVRNLFNNQTLGAGVNGFNTTILPDENSPLDSDGLPTQFIRSDNFGKARGNGSYPVPRAFRFAVGFRF